MGGCGSFTLLISVTALLGFAPSAEAADAVVRFVSGQAAMKAGAGQAVRIKEGSRIPAGAMIRTGSKSLALVELPDGSRVKLIENTRVRLGRLSDSAEGQTEIHFEQGGVFSDVKKQLLKAEDKPRFLIRTRSAVMGVRGTRFFSMTGGAAGSKVKDLWMCVNEGSVEIKSNLDKAAKLVNEGEGILVKDGAKLTDPRPYEWTRELNWNMDPAAGKLETPPLKNAYFDVLEHDYD